MAGQKASETKNDAPAVSNPAQSGSSPPVRWIVTFAIAVAVGLAIQKALPALDVALSCHAKVVCSSHFVGHRPLDSIDIGVVG